MNRYLVTALAVVLGLTVVLYLPSGFHAFAVPSDLDTSNVQYGVFGSRDFIQYWGACQIAAQGQDPYSAVAQYEVQKSVGLDWYQPVMMWNPPVVLGILCPWMPRVFSTAVSAWTGMNVLMALGAIFFCVRLFSRSRIRIPVVLAAATFYPLADCLSSGQLGILLLFSWSLSLWCMRQGYGLAGGAALAMIVVKPHLFIPVALWLTYRWIKLRIYKEPVGFLLASLALALVLQGDSISAWQSWWGVTTRGPDMQVAQPSDWRSDMLGADIKALFLAYGLSGAFGATISAFVGMLVLGGLLMRGRLSTDVSSECGLITALSILSAPYGWMSDFALLLIPNIALGVLLAGRMSQVGAAATLLALQMALVLTHPYGLVWWFPAVLVGLSRLRRTPVSAG
jgi:hypothetical protein